MRLMGLPIADAGSADPNKAHAPNVTALRAEQEALRQWRRGWERAVSHAIDGTGSHAIIKFSFEQMKAVGRERVLAQMLGVLNLAPKRPFVDVPRRLVNKTDAACDQVAHRTTDG
mgnify:CR=1 FL=1